MNAVVYQSTDAQDMHNTLADTLCGEKLLVALSKSSSIQHPHRVEFQGHVRKYLQAPLTDLQRLAR